jgi:hypothetical protein
MVEPYLETGKNKFYEGSIFTLIRLFGKLPNYEKERGFYSLEVSIVPLI